MKEKSIALSKTKFGFVVLGSILFVALGVWLVSLDAGQISSFRKYNNPLFIHGIGAVSILFFGICGGVAIKKFFDRRPGLILSKEGFIDNSSGLSAGFVPWSELIGIEPIEIQKQKMISIYVADSDKYLKRGSALQRMTKRANMALCGTPINISTQTLKIGHLELLDEMRRFHQN